MRARLFPKIYDLGTLWRAWQKVKKKGSAGGIDRVSVEIFEQSIQRNLQQLSQGLQRGTYVPEPAKRIYVPKTNPKEKRALALPAIRDKIVQEATRSTIESLFNPAFLDSSYAYRPGKGPQKAVRRVEHHLREEKTWAASADIDNFFDSINHRLLLKYLSQKIWEEEILRLVELWLKMGVVHQNRWVDLDRGVLQGNVISPLLSNIYLHPFDAEMANKGYALVRYADNFLFLEKSRDEAVAALSQAEAFLKQSLSLSLNPESRSIRALSQGFVFLGFLFHADHKTIAQAKLQKIRETIREILSRNTDLTETVATLNETVLGWRNYYQLGEVGEQFKFLDSVLLNQLGEFLRRRKILGAEGKGQVREQLQGLELFTLKGDREKRNLVSLLIAGAENKRPRGEPEKLRVHSVAEEVASKRRKYEKILARESDLLISTPGSFVGKTSRRVVVREKGKRVREIPFFRLKNILIISGGVSLSSDLVWHCTEQDIPITFFDAYGKPYAQILSPKSPLYRLSLAQLTASCDGRGVHLAASFVQGKLRNQINLLKYYRKYKARKESLFAQQYEDSIEAMRQLLTKLRQMAKGSELESVRPQLFALEGQAASYYWGLIKALLSSDVYFEGRERRGATDLVNSLLNYGYGILYSEIHQSIILTGLNPNMSFLHKEQVGKPTLVFDLIEEFRQPIVDKAVIRLLRRKKRLDMEGVSLTQNTKTEVVQAVQEKMNSRVTFRGKKMTLREVIKSQADLLAKFLESRDTYRPFIDRW